MQFFSRPLIGPRIVAGSTRQQTVGRINQVSDRWQDQSGSRPLSGSTRQQTVGRINQAADRRDGNEDEDKYEYEDEDEDEIPNYAVLLTALVKRVGVSRMRDVFLSFTFCFNHKTLGGLETGLYFVLTFQFLFLNFLTKVLAGLKPKATIIQKN